MYDNESDSYPLTLQGLERHVVEVAEECQFGKNADDTKFWLDPELRRLREERQEAPTSVVRAKISKLILKVTRRKLREYRTKQIQERLTEFADFQHIEHAHMYPVKTKVLPSRMKTNVLSY